MAHVLMVEAYVRQLLAARFGERASVEFDGGRPVFCLPGPAEPFVRVVGVRGRGLRVEVTATAAVQVRPSAALLEHLNDVNASLPYARVFLDEDRVVVQDTLLGDGVDREALDNAVDVVVWVARVHGPELAEAGGGQATVPAGDRVRDDAAGEPGGQSSANGRGSADTDAAATTDASGPRGAARTVPVDGEVASHATAAVSAAGYL